MFRSQPGVTHEGIACNSLYENCGKYERLENIELIWNIPF